jgi:hypothetical protein
MSEDNPAKEPVRQFNSGMPKEPLRPEAQNFSIDSAPELALCLIMCLPEEKDRLARVRDFCRLYHVEAKQPAQPRTSLQAEAPIWSDQQRKAIEAHEQGVRGLGRIVQPER